MGASILVIGEKEFQSSLLQTLVPEPTTFTVEVAANPFEAMLLVQAQQPDLLLIQAGQIGGLELCHQLKVQSRLAWIYCIVLVEGAGIAPTERSEFTDLQIQALEGGADACLRFDLAQARLPEARLLEAQIQVGLRQVENHRNLMRENDLLSAIALADPLTELNNRRALEWEMPRQISNARARRQPISLLMLDVDYFKSINDTHGHLVGDRALEILATRLRHNLRLYDTPFRYGGEEFVIILSDTDRQEAWAIGNRLCQLIREQPFVVDETLILKVTISAGSATLEPEDDEQGMSLLERADQRLLRAKAAGRDRVIGSDRLQVS
jgi:two-component system, cell cycle response regulator